MSKLTFIRNKTLEWRLLNQFINGDHVDRYVAALREKYPAANVNYQIFSRGCNSTLDTYEFVTVYISFENEVDEVEFILRESP